MHVLKDVTEGQANPLMHEDSPDCAMIHGDTGLDVSTGNAFNNHTSAKEVLQGKGVNNMFNLIQKEFQNTGEKVTIVFTGPLTNGALLFNLYPEIKAAVEVVVMGGCMGIGNTGAVAEFNIQVDPFAAKIVFDAGVPLTLVPLEVRRIDQRENSYSNKSSMCGNGI